MQKTFTQLCFELDAFHSSKRSRPLHIFSVFPKVDVEDLPHVSREAGVGISVKAIGENVYEIEIVSAYKRRRAYGYLIDFRNFWNILIRTVESPTVAGNIATLWLKRLYPAICRSYIKSDDLLNIMDDLSKIENSRLEMRGYVLRAHDSPETMKRWPRDRPYSRERIEQDINRENKLLEGMNFIFRIQEAYANIRVETSGHFVLYEGGPRCFSNFHYHILSRFNNIALINRKFFSNRERRVIDGEVEISRISLNPIRKLTKTDLQSFSLHLSANYSTAVFHSGNPWLFLNIIDRGDGSSFDIYGYSSEIQIVPFNKASAESLMRLFYSISEFLPLVKIK